MGGTGIDSSGRLILANGAWDGDMDEGCLGDSGNEWAPGVETVDFDKMDDDFRTAAGIPKVVFPTIEFSAAVCTNWSADALEDSSV
jgi:hypothetical protein